MSEDDQEGDDMRPRGLSPVARLALEVLVAAPGQRLGISEFEERLLQRGTNSTAIKNAVMGLIRRRWLRASGLMIVLATNSSGADPARGTSRPDGELTFTPAELAGSAPSLARQGAA